jgi:hypothetical protein
MSKIVYKSSLRIHEPPWLLLQAKDLLDKGVRQKDSSKILYSCLELRNCLEMVEYRMILASVEETDREQIMVEAKPRQGINKVNNKIKTLKYKYQIFYKTICETLDHSGYPFDFSKSANLKEALSNYVHTYTRTKEELEYGSLYLKSANEIIKEVIDFLELSLNKEKGKNSYTLQNMCMTTLSSEYKQILDNWKNGTIKDESELKDILSKKN